MNATIVTRFRTVREVYKLVTYTFPPKHRMWSAPRADGLGNKDDLGRKVYRVEGEFCHLRNELKEWRKTQKSNYTKTGALDGWLRANNARIRTMLTNLETALIEYASHFCPEDTNTWAFIQDAWAALDEMWQLDLEDTELIEIERMSQRLQSADELREKRMKSKALAERRRQYLARFESLSKEDKEVALRAGLIYLLETLGKKTTADKAEPVQPEVEPELPALDANGLIASLDEALAGDGLDVEGEYHKNRNCNRLIHLLTPRPAPQAGAERATTQYAHRLLQRQPSALCG